MPARLRRPGRAQSAQEQNREGDLRRRLLLVRGGRFRQGAGRDLDHLRLHQRQDENPTYKQVSPGGTGHAEAVEIVYDPAKVSYAKLLDVFWRNIDPLVKDRQFCDSGDMYRTAIFYLDDEQSSLAEKTKEAVRGALRAAGLTEIARPTRSTRPRTITRITTRRTRRVIISTAGTAAATSASSSCGARRSIVMTERAMLLGGAGAVALLAGCAGCGSDAAPAGKFEIEKSDRSGAALLTPAQYDVLRKHGTERRAPARSTRRSARARSPARAATCRCSPPTPNMKAAPAGRASGSRCRMRSAQRPTGRSS